LGISHGSLNLADSPETVKQWDSVGHLTLIATIDDCLDVSVDDEELRNFKSIGELIDRLRARNALED
jgi:acyl carrier protein